MPVLLIFVSLSASTIFEPPGKRSLTVTALFAACRSVLQKRIFHGSIKLSTLPIQANAVQQVLESRVGA